jgi:hypothetical protein
LWTLTQGGPGEQRIASGARTIELAGKAGPVDLGRLGMEIRMNLTCSRSERPVDVGGARVTAKAQARPGFVESHAVSRR